MEAASGLIKLKPNSNQKLEEWKSTLSERLDEAMVSLRDEGVEIESWFKIEIENQTYLLWYMRAESIEKAFEVFQASTHPIDKYHFELMAGIMADNGNIVAKPLLEISTK